MVKSGRSKIERVKSVRLKRGRSKREASKVDEPKVNELNVDEIKSGQGQEWTEGVLKVDGNLPIRGHDVDVSYWPAANLEMSEFTFPDFLNDINSPF